MSKLKYAYESLFLRDINKNLYPNLHRIMDGRLTLQGQWLDSLKRDRGWFNLELRGTLNQIQKGIAYLEELELEIWGKPNTDGDSWHY